MRLLLLTQSDPFYLAQNIKYLLQSLPKQHDVVACVLFDVSPSGRKKSIFKQAKETLSIFGCNFFIHYSIKYLLSIINPNKKVSYVLNKFDIPIIRLKKSINAPESLNTIKAYKPDLLISIAGNQIFKLPLINLAPKGCLNLHTALLPKNRGLMPSFWTLKNEDKETGVSVFFVDEGIDSGPILVQKKISIQPNMTQQQLIKLSKKIGMESIVEAINKIESGSYTLIENDNLNMTYNSYPTKQDVTEFYKTGHRFF